MTDARRLRTDLSLRVSGILSLAIAATAIHTLARLYPQTGALAFLLATIGFLCVSAGAVLVVVGGHIHDPVRISARWQRAARRAAP
ncbi:hypothetical protein [Sphingomonas sp. R86520]|uniref:hypothetical protein n=1 Tax=Sphingomonas sp. R86520 TaxID=3093859 RepID=UPI0036D22625